MKRTREILRSISGEGYIDTVVMVMVVVLVLALVVNVLPAFIVKSELSSFVNEISRVAGIEGEIGSVTSAKENELRIMLGINPTLDFSRTGKIQLNETFVVTATKEVDIGFFEFGSFPITLTSKAVGRSKVYHK
ncbi:MAG: DUF4320 family protein [Alkaliphilus sp.]